MTVRELIKELRKWPGDWKVATAFYDNPEDEIQWQLNFLHELAAGEHKNDLGNTVVIRP